MRGLVGGYYFALRTALRNKPHLRRYRVRCRHCRIFFIADPRNAGREDLGCPFGCAELHRRRESNKRSAAYNRSAVGKLKRKQRQQERKLLGSLPKSEEPELPQVQPAASALASSSDAAECDHRSHRGDPSLPDAVPSAVRETGQGMLQPVEIAAGMVTYIRAVVSLIEGRRVHRVEVIEMLQRTKRQHSLARERRIDYVLRYLKEHPS